MPISYQFRNASTDEPVELAKIDDEICQDFGIASSKDVFSMAFEIITMIGDVATKSGRFKQEDFDSAMRRMECDDHEKRWLYLKYIHGKYHYHSWR